MVAAVFMGAPFAGHGQLHDYFPEQWPFFLTFSKKLDTRFTPSLLVFAHRNERQERFSRFEGKGVLQETLRDKRRKGYGYDECGALFPLADHASPNAKERYPLQGSTEASWSIAELL
jgi:hypothetical protein